MLWLKFSFSSPIAVAKMAKTMLNNSGESGQLCLHPDLSGSCFIFSPLRKMLAVGFIYGLYYVEVSSLFAYFLESLYHK